MNYYAFVCENGDTMISSQPLTTPLFCKKCGTKMLSKCPSCGRAIEEWHRSDDFIAGKPRYARANYCQGCGKPYPWTQTALDAAKELILESEELDILQRQKLAESLPDLITETPKTQVAVVRVRKAMLSVGKFTADGIHQFIIDFGCELAKKQLGL